MVLLQLQLICCICSVSTFILIMSSSRTLTFLNMSYVRVPAGLTRSKVGKRIVYQSNPPGLRVKIWNLRDFDELKLKGRFSDIDREALNFSTKKTNERANEEVCDGAGHVDEMQVGDGGHANMASTRARNVEEFSDSSGYTEGVSARHAKEVLDGADKSIEIMEIESISDKSLTGTDTRFTLSVNCGQFLNPVTYTQVPDLSNSSHLPIVSNSSHLPILSNSSHLPIFSNSSHLPNLSNSSDLPILSDSSHLPIHGNSSNLPTTFNSSQFTIPGTSRQVLIPEIKKISKVR